MRFDVITIFPEMFESPFKQGVVGQAVQRGEVQVQCLSPRAFTADFHKTVDDRPYGGGDGMVMLAQPLKLALEKIKSESQNQNSKVIYLSPQGAPLTHGKVLELSKLSQIILICGRYGGVDQRFLNTYVEEEISIGDYVLSGGELAAMVLIDAVARQLNGVLGNTDSKEVESFADGLLEAPQYSRPASFEGVEVPKVLASGHHENILKTRRLVSILITQKKRPDLIEKANISQKEFKQAEELYTSLTEAEKQAWGLT